MITGPKLAVGDSIASIGEFAKFCHGVIEFHTFDSHFADITYLTPYMRELRRIGVALYRLVVHMPFDNLDIFEATQRVRGMTELTQLFRFLRRISIEEGIEVGLLTHCMLFNDYYERSHSTTLILDLIEDIWHDTNCFILVENSIVDPNRNPKADYGYESGWELAIKLNHPQVQLAFDTCHWKCTTSLLQVEEVLPRHIGSQIRHVHLSTVLNNDGFLDRLTHGRAHQTVVSLQQDLIRLNCNLCCPDKRRKDISLVTEINEEDYILRPHLLNELTMLEEFVRQEENYV